MSDRSSPYRVAPAPGAAGAPARRDGWGRDHLIALAFAFFYALLLVRTVDGLGYARDEGFYFQAASSYERWFETLWKTPTLALERRTLDGAWSVNHEHPALIKSLFALSHLVLFKRWHLFAVEGTSYRFPAMVLSGLGVGLVYLWGARARGRAAGVAAAVLLGAMPHFFYHAHLACFDAPIVTLWLLCAYAYWRSLERGGIAWPLLTGLAFGLALDTKHNAWFLPFLCLTQAAVLPPRARLRGSRAPGQGRRALAALACMLTVGPLVFYALWPWIWRDTLPRLAGYARFHLEHDYYNMQFLGPTYWKPPMPRAYAPVMTAATVPIVTLCLFAAGLWLRARSRLRWPLARLVAGASALVGRPAPRWAAAARAPAVDRASTDLLWLGGLLINYVAWLSPKTPIFGGTKHWMTAYPFLCLFAGVAFAGAVTSLRREWRLASRRGALRGKVARLGRGPLPEVLLGAAVAVAPIVETARAHPWGLGSYTPLVGGAAGAATLGLNRSFWGYTTGAVAGYLNQAPRGATVYPHDTAAASWEMLQRGGRLRKDLRAVWSIAEAQYGLYHHEPHMEGQEYQAWIAFGTARPDHVAGLDGVPVIWVYERPTPAR